jgi:Tol biopolymer transport system component
MRTTDAILLLLLAISAGCSRATGTPDRAQWSTGARAWSGEDPDLTTGDVSPDGRYFTDIEWGSGDLDVVDLETGQARHLTGQGYDAGGYAWSSAFSTDGRRLAVAWYVDRHDSHDLRVMNFDGTGSRVLIPAGAGPFYVDPVDWSTTDAEILVGVRNANRTWQLELVSVRDGARRIIKRLGWQTPGGGHDQAYPDAKMSRDGRFIAYDYPPVGGDHTRDVFAVEVSTGETTALVTGPGSDRLLGWLPDGNGILFYSDRSGTPAVWRLGVRNGRASGAPALVRAGVRGVIPLGFTTRGYAYGVAAESERVHTVAIDSTSGTVREPSRAVADPVWRTSLAGDWSPDGSRLAYVAHDPFPDPAETLLIVSEKGDVIRRIPLTPAVHSSNGTLRWVSEDRILLFGYEQGREGIHVVDLRSGTVRPLATPEAIGRAALKWFEAGPEGRTLYFVAFPKAGSRENELLAFDVATGTHRVLGTARAIPNSIAVSPDGSELAFLARTDATLVVRFMSTATGASRALPGTPPGRLSAPLAWTPDGSRVIVEVTDSTGTPALWSIGTHGGEAVRVLTGCCRENDVRLDRQGRRIAFAAGADRGEIWFLTY